MKATALVAAVLALGVAVVALMRTFGGDPGYTDAQRADAKNSVCAAFETVRSGVATNTNATPPGDIAGALAVAANARIALFDGGQYLLAKLDPATPPELAEDVRTFANELMDIGAAATAGVPNDDPEQAGRLRDAEAASAAVNGHCG
ncbi:hypothetical protein MPNTM1_04234 [Mycolicibacterium parafortuitum]|uniref:hypothetical protein n=1 Tax=Mycolicibacterium parafortuitum TaxID=39692 RepID=UPI0032C3FD77